MSSDHWRTHSTQIWCPELNHGQLYGRLRVLSWTRRSLRRFASIAIGAGNVKLKVSKVFKADLKGIFFCRNLILCHWCEATRQDLPAQIWQAPLGPWAVPIHQATTLQIIPWPTLNTCVQFAETKHRASIMEFTLAKAVKAFLRGQCARNWHMLAEKTEIVSLTNANEIDANIVGELLWN